MNEERGRAKVCAQMSAAALDHIKERGRLEGFEIGRDERLALMKAAMQQNLVMWNRTERKYELTTNGHKRRTEYRRKIARV